ncbi:MAG: glycosyltransferase [Lachnospiraceae bacterium]|nr:glycosyltransferase [Lachnospiraceae bacterium]
MNESKKVVSIVIPIYNVEEYLRTCLDSILKQTYDALEVLMVDDGSKDASGQICDEYQSKDSRFVAIHKENGGAADARNVALDRCTGEYVTFIDGDDYVAPDFVERLVALTEKCDSDIAICGWNNVSETKVEPFCKNSGAIKEYETEQALEALLYQEDFDTAMWPKLYKTSLFEGIRFPKGNLYEDIAIIYEVFLKAAKVAFEDYAGYYYLLRESGTTLMKFRKDKMDLIDVVETMEKVLCDKYPDLKKAAASRVVRANFHIYMQIPQTQEYVEERRRIEHNIKSRRSVVLKDARTKRGTKVALVLTLFGFRFFLKFKALKNMGKK